MHDFISYVSNLHMTTVAAMVMLVGAGSYIMSFIVDSRFLLVVFAAAFMSGAVLMDYIFKANGVDVGVDGDANIILVATLGMIAGLVVMVGVIRLYGIATDNSKTRIVRDRRCA